MTLDNIKIYPPGSAPITIIEGEVIGNKTVLSIRAFITGTGVPSVTITYTNGKYSTYLGIPYSYEQ